MRNRSLSLLLALSLLAACTASCQSASDPAVDGTDTSADTTADIQSEGKLPDNLPDVDMDGFELSFLNHDIAGWEWSNTRISMEEQNGEALNDAFYHRTQGITERFNCKIRIEEEPKPHEQIVQNVMAGDAAFDVYTVLDDRLPRVMMQCTSWDAVPYLDLEKPWWNPDATGMFNIAGVQAALAGSVTLSPVSRAVCMVFNKDIYATLNTGEDLYALVQEGKWTFDAFQSMSKLVYADLDGDSFYDESDRYLLNYGRGFKGYIMSFLVGGGIELTEAGPDDAAVFTLHKNEKAINYFQKLLDAMEDDSYQCISTVTAGSFQPSNFFSDGHALFTMGVPHDIIKLRDMNDEIGILPIPKMDENQKQYYAPSYGNVVFVLPSTVTKDRAENIGILMEAMAYDGYYDVLPVYKENALKTKAARDEESAAMLDIIFDSIVFDFGLNFLLDPVLTPTVLTDLLKASDRSGVLVSTLNKYLPKLETQVEDIMEGITAMPTTIS